MVDALTDRGIADEMIAPLRARLAQIRPRRPLRFARLLFLPFDPLIVPVGNWSAGAPTIPRSAVPPLADTVWKAMGAQAVAINEIIENRTTDEHDIVNQAGTLLWPVAARVLAEAPPPIDWSRAGIPFDLYKPLACSVAALLEQVVPLQAFLAEAELGVSLQYKRLQPILAGASACGSATLVMMVALLLAYLPEAGPLLDTVASATGERDGAALRDATEQAIDVLLDRLDVPGGIEVLVVGSDLTESGARVRQIAVLLNGLQARDGAASRKSRLAGILQRLDASCRTRFANGLQTEFIAVLDTLRPEPEAAALIRLEEVARGLQQLEQEARPIGSAEVYDRLLRKTVATLRKLKTSEALSLVDKARLVEILVGPDEALAMLDDDP